MTLANPEPVHAATPVPTGSFGPCVSQYGGLRNVLAVRSSTMSVTG